VTLSQDCALRAHAFGARIGVAGHIVFVVGIREPVGMPPCGADATRIVLSQDIPGAVGCASLDVVRRSTAHRGLEARRLDDQHIAFQRIENPFGRMADQGAPDARSGNYAQHQNVGGVAPGNERKKLCSVAFENLDAILADAVMSRECQDLSLDPVPVSSADVLLHSLR